jgi:hypothetical protein
VEVDPVTATPETIVPVLLVVPLVLLALRAGDWCRHRRRRRRDPLGLRALASLGEASRR